MSVASAIGRQRQFNSAPTGALRKSKSRAKRSNTEPQPSHRDSINTIGQKRKGSERANVVRFSPECVAKLSLRPRANRDSVGLRGDSRESVHDGAARGWTRAILLRV